MMTIIPFMRYAPEHKDETRERVLAEAAKQIRAHGPQGVGVATIMKRAGLTHGGFYAHFSSKDELVTAAIEKMFEGSRTRWELYTAERDAAGGLAAYIDWYLSAEHRDTRAAGCPIAALSSDLPRLGKSARVAYAAGARDFTKRIAGKLRELGLDADRLAPSMVAELVGALALARVEPDEKRSNDLLTASRRALHARLARD